MNCSLTEEHCDNRRVHNKEWQNVSARNTEYCGVGLFADSDICADKFIIEYVGEVMTQTMYDDKHSSDHQDDNFYGMHMKDTAENKVWVVDPTDMGNRARFINHCCTPNCRVEIRYTGEEPHICIFADVDIQAGDELTLDYKWKGNKGAKPIQCGCKSSKCRGTL